MAIVLNIIHCRFHSIPLALNLDDLCELTLLTHKYHLTHVLRPWATTWVNAATLQMTDYERRLYSVTPDMYNLERMSWIAWVMGDDQLYARVGEALATYCSVDAANGNLLYTEGENAAPLFTYTQEPPGLHGMPDLNSFLLSTHH